MSISVTVCARPFPPTLPRASHAPRTTLLPAAYIPPVGETPNAEGALVALLA